MTPHFSVSPFLLTGPFGGTSYGPRSGEVSRSRFYGKLLRLLIDRYGGEVILVIASKPVGFYIYFHSPSSISTKNDLCGLVLATLCVFSAKVVVFSL